jgi:hypothetical protein
LETGAGDRVRSPMRERACSATCQILRMAAGKLGMPSTHCRVGPAVLFAVVSDHLGKKSRVLDRALLDGRDCQAMRDIEAALRNQAAYCPHPYLSSKIQRDQALTRG